MKDKKKKIIDFLKEHGRSSTTSVALAISSSVGYTNKYLNELLEKGKVKREQETNSVYWSVE
jgi:predicted transcriptional regulator